MTLYSPILKWKQGEYLAFNRLAPEIKEQLDPIFEITPPADYDFEDEEVKKTIDDHLAKFGARYKANIGSKTCFIDTHLIAADVRMKDNRLPLQFIFDELTKLELNAIPVLHLSSDETLRSAIKTITTSMATGFALRLSTADLLKTDILKTILQILADFKISVRNIDLIIDYAKPTSFEPIADFTKMLVPLITKVLDPSWRRLIIVGTSFPASMTEVKPPHQLKERSEWKAYFNILKLMHGLRPIFGDYGIRPPGYVQIDPRTMVPKNKIIYTIDDHWLIVKGLHSNRPYTDKKGDTHRGTLEYHILCQNIVKSGFFMGAKFSHADNIIANCAAQEEGCTPGNQNSWIAAGTNHHLTKVVTDLSKLFSS